MNWGWVGSTFSWLRNATRLDWSSSGSYKWQRHVFSVVVAAMAGVPLLLARLGPAVRGDRDAGDVWVCIVGGILVGYVFVRGVAAVFGSTPLTSSAMKDRWRVAWAVGLASLSILLMTHIVFAWFDNIRKSSESACATQVGVIDEPTGVAETPETTEPSESAASTDPASTEATDDTTEETAASGFPDDTVPAETTETTVTETTVTDRPSDDATPIGVAGARPTERFGPLRQLQWHTFIVKVASAENGGEQADALAAIGCAAFVVIADDDRPTSAFVSSVTALTEGQLAVRLNVDTAAIDALDGGSYRVSAINTSDVPLEQNRLELDVVLQSRIVYYLLALLPPIVVAAMMQAFEGWPRGLKRWFTSVVAVTAPAVTAFAATGLRNDRWGPTLFSVGAIIAATYTAAVTAATVVNRAGSGIR